jgi:glutamate racemase
MNKMAPIGVFDSGIGGLSILQALQRRLPHERWVYFSDSAHAPYGERGDDFVAERSLAITELLLKTHGVKAMVVACNTATASAITAMRARYTDLPIVGVEPALRPALSQTRTRNIGVMATRGTVNSQKFRDLLASLEDQAHFVIQACDGLAKAIEAQNEQEIRALFSLYTSAIGQFGYENQCVDTLVLGCTHYTLEADLLRQILGVQVALLEPGDGVARQLERLLAQGCLQAPTPTTELCDVTWLASGSTSALTQAVNRWWHPTFND